MSRYIDADIAKEKLKEYCVDDDNTVRYWYDLMGIDDCIDKIIPTADVRENVKGKWIITKTERGWNCAEYPTEVTCSNCNYIEDYQKALDFCPNCGADMRGDA